MKKTHSFRRTLAFTAISLISAGNAMASMGNLATTYGVMPSDIASAQALSMFSPHVSATYYNPAYLVNDPRGELTVGIMHAEQELRAKSPARDGDIVSDSPSQHVLIGMKTNLGSLTKSSHPIQFGFIAGVEKYGDEMLAFDSQTSEEGQFLTYGREPLFLNLGVGTKIWRGIDVGLGARVTLEAEASLDAVSNLAGETRQEKLGVSAKPAIKGIVSVNMNYGDTFCRDADCFLDGFESALVYRAKSNTKTTVNSNIIVDQTIPSPGLNLAVTTIDSFQPEIIAFGTQYKTENWRVGLTIEHQKWSELGDEFDGDTIKDQAGVSKALQLDFDDIIVPRIGGELMFNNNFSVTAGFSYEDSPLTGDRSPEVNYFDNNKYIVGLGLSAFYDKTRYLAFPVRFDLGYQYQMLQERDYVVTPFGTENGTEVVNTDGDVHVFSGSMTLKF